MPLLKQRRILAMAVETTPGTSVSLATGGMFAFNPMFQATIPPTEREATGTLGSLPAVPGTRMGKITFDLELSRDPTNIQPLWASTLLPACGMVSSSNSSSGAAIWSPTSNPGNYKTLSMGIYEQTSTGSVLKSMVGSMGTFSLDFDDAKPPMIKFEFSGVYVSPASATYPALPSFPPIPPRFAGATFTLTPNTSGSPPAYTPKIKQFTMDYGATVKLVEDVSQISGFAYAVVTDRKPKGKIDPMAEPISVYSPYVTWTGITLATMNMQFSNASGTTTVGSPAFQVVNSQEADRDKLVTESVDFEMCQGVGDDEVTLAFA